jgi:aryl-alcohol dehydrogenase-like predicted oxidoreductase
MVYRRLGQTDLFLSLLSFGSHTDPSFKVHKGDMVVLNPEGQAIRDRQVARALDYGVTMVDVYESEGQWEPLARLVNPRRKNVLVSTCRQFSQYVGDDIDQAAKLFGGYVDLYRIYPGEGPKVDEKMLLDWDTLRKAKEAGKVRAIGIATHGEPLMCDALEQLEGLDYVMFPYNFIHAKVDYSRFLPAAQAKGVGLIAIKPMAAGSIVSLDPRARQGSKPQDDKIQLYQSKYHPILPAVVDQLTSSLHRLPDETLCQAALRFVYSQRFLTAAMPGMFEDFTVEDNYKALCRYSEMSREEVAALAAAKQYAELIGPGWLPPHYRWLDERWRA